ncbi:MAG: hypothetical protein Kow00107_06080 [Planctomycetota bacterium]
MSVRGGFEPPFLCWKDAMRDYSEVVAYLKALVPPAIASDPIMSQVMDEFLAEIPQKVDDIGSFLAEGNNSEAKRFAHQLKGSGGTFGLDEIAGVARKLEAALGVTPLPKEVNELYLQLRRSVGFSD